MATKTSTGLRNYILASGSVKDALDGMVFRFYSGTVPGTADAALGSAVQLSEIMADGTDGVTFDEASVNNGSISKLASETWITGPGGNDDSGTATFWRLVVPADDGSASTTALRLQGGIAMTGSEINLTDTDLVASAPQSLNFFNVVLPSNEQFSRGLRDALMATDSFAGVMDGATLIIAEGTLGTPEANYTGATILSTITNGGAGLTWGTGDVANGVLPKTVSEVWDNSDAGGNDDTGVAQFFILYHPLDDDLSASTTALRVVGSVGTAGAVLNLSSVNLVATSPQNVNSFTVAIPTM